MQNKLHSVGAELGKVRCKGVKMGELNDTERSTLHVVFQDVLFCPVECARGSVTVPLVSFSKNKFLIFHHQE